MDLPAPDGTAAGQRQDRRADIETFARELEARGRARATVTRRLSCGARLLDLAWADFPVGIIAE